MLIALYAQNLLIESTKLILRKESYLENSDVIAFNFENIDKSTLQDFLNSLSIHNITYTSEIHENNRLTVTAFNPDHTINKTFSKLGFDIVKEYLTQDLSPQEVSSGIYTRALNSINTTDNACQYHQALRKVELYEANPLYIFWCIKNIKSFYLDGNKDNIPLVTNLPCFYLNSFTASYSSEDSAIFNPLIEATKMAIYKNTIEENYKKLLKYDSQDFTYQDNNDTDDVYKQAFDELTDGQYGEYGGYNDSINDHIGL
ncbi:hypothetical protein [Hymenobacter lutimineralis]|nr:hypothetical protein [Hymenobacter lutimineralis]